MIFDNFFLIYLLFFNSFIYCENRLSNCPENNPFLLTDSTCGNFEKVCLRTEDKQCDNLISACQQCPSSNYTLPMLMDILKMLKKEITEIKQNQTNEIKTMKSSIESMKIFLEKEINLLKVQTNNNETSVLKLKIDQLSKKVAALHKSQSAELTTMKDELKNKIIELQSENGKLSGLVVAVIVIEIILFIILLLEVRFKMITKVVDMIRKTENPRTNTCRATENPRTNTCRASGSLMISRKVNSFTEMKDEIVRINRENLISELSELKSMMTSLKSDVAKWVSLKQIAMSQHTYEEQNNVQSDQICSNISGIAQVPSNDESAHLIPEQTK